MFGANPASNSDQNSLSIRYMGVLWVNPAPVLREGIGTLPAAAKSLVTRLKQVGKSGGGLLLKLTFQTTTNAKKFP